MKKFLLSLGVTAIISVVSTLVWYGYEEYMRLNNDILLLSGQSQKYIQALSDLEKDIKDRESIIEQNEKYLSYSGILHYIPIDGFIRRGNTGVLIASSYDAVRFHNVDTQSVLLEIYDTDEISTVSPLVTFDIASGSVSFFSLKKSGIYIYRSAEQQGRIIIGQDYLERYNLESFLETEIFPLIDKKDSSSVRRSLLRFKEITANNPLISKNCHNLVHEIGHRAFALYGFSIAISSGQDDICAGGYTHGVLESYFLSEPSLAGDPESACSTIEDKKKGSCFHGVGHGLMFVSANDIPLSLASCRKLSTPVWRNRCTELVFMELYSGDPKHAGGKIKYSTGDLFSPCKTYGTESEGYVCGFYAGLGYLRYESEDYPGALGACESGGEYKNMCIRGVGREIAKRYIGDALKLENICLGLTNFSSQGNCLEGGINYTKLQFDDDAALIEGYCRGFQKTPSSCITQSGKLESSVSPESIIP